MADNNKLSDLDEEAIYADALAELESGKTRPGLWAKALAESEGDENKSRALYIKFRVQQERALSLQEHEVVDELAAESTRQRNENERQLDQVVTIDQTDVHSSEKVPMSSEKAVTINGGETKKQPSGVGGWLRLLVVGMMVIGPLFGLLMLGGNITEMETEYPALKSLPKWDLFKAATWGVFLLSAALSLHGGWRLKTGKDWWAVKRAKLVLWLIGPVRTILMDFIIPVVTSGVINGSIIAQSIGSLIASIIITTIWTAYLSKSKRVRNTYGPPL